MTKERSGSREALSGVGTQISSASASAARAGDGGIRNVHEVTFARVQRGGLGLVDVEADDAESGLGEAQRKRQPDIAEADHPDARGARAAALDEGRGQPAQLALREFHTLVSCFDLGAIFMKFDLAPSNSTTNDTLEQQARPAHGRGIRCRRWAKKDS